MLFHTLFAQWIEHVLFFWLLLKTLIKKIIKETVTNAGQINNLKVHFFPPGSTGSEFRWSRYTHARNAKKLVNSVSD